MYNDISSIGQYELALKDKLTPKEAAVMTGMTETELLKAIEKLE